MISIFVPLSAFLASSAGAFLLSPNANTARPYAWVSLFGEKAPVESTVADVRRFTIPLEQLNLNDIPKVGG
jgi:hypothetical protein